MIATATAQPTQPPSSSPSPVATATPVGSGILYYVAPTGADNNPGTASLPWLTIQHAVSAMLSGDTTQVAAGTYPEGVLIISSGTSTKPITLTAAPGADAKVLIFVISDASYWVINGFDISNQTAGDGPVSSSKSQGQGLRLAARLHHPKLETRGL